MADNPKSTERVVTQNVTVIRDGKRVTPPLNKKFSFTAAEIKYLDRVSPAASRKPTDENVTLAADLEDVEGGETGTDNTAPDQKAKPTAKRTPRRGANKAEVKAEEADEEADEDEGDAGDDAGEGDEGTDEEDADI